MRFASISRRRIVSGSFLCFKFSFIDCIAECVSAYRNVTELIFHPPLAVCYVIGIMNINVLLFSTSARFVPSERILQSCIEDALLSIGRRRRHVHQERDVIATFLGLFMVRNEYRSSGTKIQRNR
jgi:hypothetical protein